jgi:hypothetical protein
MHMNATEAEWMLDFENGRIWILQIHTANDNLQSIPALVS